MEVCAIYVVETRVVMAARRLITILSDQKEELLSHDLGQWCQREEEGQHCAKDHKGSSTHLF